MLRECCNERETRRRAMEAHHRAYTQYADATNGKMATGLELASAQV